MNSWVWNAARTAVMALAGVLCGTAWGQTTDFNTGTNGFVIDQSTSGSFSTTVQGWTVVVATDPGATTTRLRLGTSTLTGAPSAGWIRGEGSAGLFNSLEFRSASQFDLDSIWTAATASTTIQPLNASYAPIGSAVAYSPGSSQTEINLSANTDFDGIYGFRIVPSDGNTLQPISQVTISNVGTPPTVTLAASPASMGETGGSSTVTATLSDTASTATTVNLAFSGTASGGGTDYTASNTSITIPSGSTTGSVTLSAASDAIAEGNETIIVDISSVSGGDGATESGTQQATVTITDDDSAAVTIADVSQAENGGAVTFTATLSAAVQGGFTVDVSTADGTATVADGDYTAVSGQTLTFAGTSGETQTFTITPGADTKVEPNETVMIAMSNLTGASGTVDISDTATLTISNDDSAAVTIADVSANEDNGAITLTATLDNAVAGGFTVDVSSADGTATTADSDYTALSGQTLTFAGTASETQTFTITPTSDTKLEANETVSVSMSNLAATALSVTITDTATVTFNNDDTAAVTIADAFGDEDAGAVTFTATLSNAVQGGFTVDVSTSDGTATTANSDYTAVSGQTLTFAGTASETQTFTVTPTSDSAIEAAETVNIAMSNLAGTSLGVDISDTATLTINNDDADATAPRVQSVTRSNPTTSPTSASTLDWAVAFNETVNNVDSTDFVVSGASVAPSITVLGSGASYTVRATGGSLSGMNGTVTLSFAPGQNIADTSANALSNTTPIGANDNTFLISNPTPPAFSLAFSPSSMAQGAASTLTYTLDNSANVVNATSLDFTNTLPANVIVAATPNASTSCTGGTLTAASGAGSISYSGGTVSASGSCTVSVNVTSSTAGNYTNTTGSLTSSLGNSGTASGGLTVTDGTSPTVTSITRLTPASETTDADAVTWRVVFSESVVNVGAADFTISGPSGASTGVTGSGSTYDVTVSGGDMAGLNATITLNIAGGNDIADASANALASTTPSGTDERSYIISNPNAPGFTAAFSPNTVAVGGTATLTFTINNGSNVVPATALGFTTTLPSGPTLASSPNAATTCTGGALTASGGASSLSYGSGSVAAGATCSISVDVIPDSAGAFTMTSGALTSSLGASASATASLTATDATPPVLTAFQRQSPSDALTNSDTLVFAISFSEAVSNVTADDFNNPGTTATGVLSGSGANYSLTLSGGDLAALDGSVSLNLSGGQDITDLAGNALPAGEPGVDQSYTLDNTSPGVTLSTASNAPASGPFTLSITFTEAVTGFALGDLTVSNGVASDLTSLSPSAYTVTISPSDDGVVTVDLGAGVATDAAGNSNSAAAQVSRTTDNTAPSAEISGPSDAALSGPFAVTITFSEIVSGFTLDDIQVGNGSASDFNATSEQIYTALITPSDDGPVTVDVAANAAEDAAGNGNLAADRFSTFNDATSPTVTLSRAGNGLAAGPFDVTINFSEPVSGLALENLAVSNGAASALTGSEAQYAVTITPTTDAEVTIDLAAGVAVDAAGNPNLAADTLRVSVDSTAPVLTIDLPGATTEGAFTARFTFDERVSGFEASDIIVTNGAVSDFMIESDRSFTALITPATAGLITVEVASAAASDQAGNGNEAAQAIIEAITGTEDVEIVIDQTTGDVTDIKAEVRIGNPGSQSLNFRVEVDVPWIAVDPVSGVIPALGDILLNVQVLPEAVDLPAGVYSGVITVVRDLPASPLMRPSATGRAATESIIVEIPLTVTIEERFGSIQLVATTPGGVQRDATFLYASSDADLDGLQLTTVGGSAASASFEKEAGLYDVSQSAPEGWRLDEISCSGDTDDGSVITLSDGRVLIDLDPNEAITCTFSNTRDEDAVRLATQRAINNFMIRRADRILAAAPDLSQRLRERETDTPGRFSAHIEGGRKALSLATSLSGIRNHVQAAQPQMPETADLHDQDRHRLDVWMRADFSALSDDRDGGDVSSDFGLLQIGADWTLGDSALVGVMVQRDWMDDRSGEIAESAGALRGARVEGEGWMAGPYMVWSLADGAWLDMLAMWGQSQNTVDPLGLYEDEFDTDRLMIRANLSGEWQSANWRVRPSISLAHFEETQGGYTDSLGIEIPEQTIRIGRLQAGPEVSYRFERRNGSWWEPGLSLNGVWDYDPAALMDELGQRISTGALRADAGLSLRARLSDGAMLSGEVRLDGLGNGDFSANSGRLEIRLPF
ncbi:MAG TPA: hypothetical protein DIV98_08070 [Oceanicaulis sp.]|nr:hypothetical protein [Oceanicaulis sp.]